MVVRMRSTRSHTGNRRSHHGVKAPEMAVCKNCGGYHRPHHMCLECGFYKGRVVIDMKAQKAARDARLQAKKAAMGAQAAAEADNVTTAAENDTTALPEQTGVDDTKTTEEKTTEEK